MELCAEEGESFAENWKSGEIAAALRIDERTVYRRWHAYRKYGWECLRVKSRALHQYYKTSQSTANLILEVRRTKHWGPNKIEGYLRNYRAVSTRHTTVHKILVQAGLNNPVSEPRRMWGKHRFEREHSKSLWQADFKLTEDDEWMISFLDDLFTLHSRLKNQPHPNSRARHQAFRRIHEVAR